MRLASDDSMVSLGWVVPFLVFAFSMSISPGPNNLLVMATSSSVGIARTLPLMFGVCLGGFGLLLISSFGASGIIQQVPAMYVVMKVIGALYLIYLAARTAMVRTGTMEVKERRAVGFFASAGFQFANPKAWMIALGAATAFAPKGVAPLTFALVAGVLFAACALVSNGAWALLGRGLSRVLGTAQRLRAFNLAIATMLIASVYFVVV
jgi:threonine/homoserine/homoserine lactone efflux protein